MRFLEIQLFRFVIWLLRRGYGANCTTCDMDDFPETYKNPKDAFHAGRCASCRAKETIEWLELHIDLLK